MKLIIDGVEMDPDLVTERLIKHLHDSDMVEEIIARHGIKDDDIGPYSEFEVCGGVCRLYIGDNVRISEIQEH